ncbi:MAG: hypothetical protein IJY25_03775 [Bacilli bacterium]|nr:hypothetical protein [Bacilli bacterium]
MDQNNNFNTQGYNNFTNNQPNTNMNNNFYQPPINNQVPKKKFNMGLIVGIGVVAIVAVVGIVFGSKLLSNNDTNNSTGGSSNNEKVDVVYYDNSRELKDSYTFKEAVSKFAFKVNESTLIFEENDKTTLEHIMQEETKHNDLWNAQFEYKQDIYTSVGQIYVGESSATTLEEFVNNFKVGKLSENTTWEVENVNIVDANNDYVFASWTNKGLVTNYEYYFAKIIGSKIYYAYNSSVVSYNDTKFALLLPQFKEFFTCLKEDDGKEPYIYDKIMNVPIVLNKRIKNIDYIYGIINSDTGYIDGSVSLNKEDTTDFITIEYGADGYYNKIDWTKKLDSNIQYMREDSENFYGIKDNGVVQIIQIQNYNDDEVKNLDELNGFMKAYLTNK